MENNAEKQNYLWYMTDRNTLKMQGIRSIVRFSEGEIVTESEDGNITVEGNNLKIENLSHNDESLSVTGNIQGVYLSENEKEGTKSFLRFFR